MGRQAKGKKKATGQPGARRDTGLPEITNMHKALLAAHARDERPKDPLVAVMESTFGEAVPDEVRDAIETIRARGDDLEPQEFAEMLANMRRNAELAELDDTPVRRQLDVIPQAFRKDPETQLMLNRSKVAEFCDLCGEGPTVRAYDARRPIQTSGDTLLLACATCERLVRVGQREVLLERGLANLDQDPDPVRAANGRVSLPAVHALLWEETDRVGFPYSSTLKTTKVPSVLDECFFCSLDSTAAVFTTGRVEGRELDGELLIAPAKFYSCTACAVLVRDKDASGLVEHAAPIYLHNIQTKPGRPQNTDRLTRLVANLHALFWLGDPDLSGRDIGDGERDAVAGELREDMCQEWVKVHARGDHCHMCGCQLEDSPGGMSFPGEQMSVSVFGRDVPTPPAWATENGNRWLACGGCTRMIERDDRLGLIAKAVNVTLDFVSSEHDTALSEDDAIEFTTARIGMFFSSHFAAKGLDDPHTYTAAQVTAGLAVLDGIFAGDVCDFCTAPEVAKILPARVAEGEFLGHAVHGPADGRWRVCGACFDDLDAGRVTRQPVLVRALNMVKATLDGTEVPVGVYAQIMAARLNIFTANQMSLDELRNQAANLIVKYGELIEPGPDMAFVGRDLNLAMELVRGVDPETCDVRPEFFALLRETDPVMLARLFNDVLLDAEIIDSAGRRALGPGMTLMFGPTTWTLNHFGDWAKRAGKLYEDYMSFLPQSKIAPIRLTGHGKVPQRYLAVAGRLARTTETWVEGVNKAAVLEAIDPAPRLMGLLVRDDPQMALGYVQMLLQAVAVHALHEADHWHLDPVPLQELIDRRVPVNWNEIELPQQTVTVSHPPLDFGNGVQIISWTLFAASGPYADVKHPNMLPLSHALVEFLSEPGQPNIAMVEIGGDPYSLGGMAAKIIHRLRTNLWKGEKAQRDDSGHRVRSRSKARATAQKSTPKNASERAAALFGVQVIDADKWERKLEESRRFEETRARREENKGTGFGMDKWGHLYNIPYVGYTHRARARIEGDTSKRPVKGDGSEGGYGEWWYLKETEILGGVRGNPMLPSREQWLEENQGVMTEKRIRRAEKKAKPQIKPEPEEM